MTIEEGISRFESFANLCEKNGMHEWQKEHEQYVAWLRELVERRKAPEIIYCSDCRWNDGTCYCNFHYRDVRPDNYCSWSERRTDADD